MTARRRGFTLLEVMVALGIMAVIAALTWGALAGAFQARDFLEESDQHDRSARVALGRISRELSLAFLTSHTDAVNTYRTVFIAKDGDGDDQVWFSTLAHRRTIRDSRECDQSEITLWTESDPNGGSGDLVLLHRESGWIDHEPDKGGTVLPLATSVARFDLRYLDSETGEWRDEWDTTGADTPNRLPRAVEITLVLRGPDPEDEDSTVEKPYLTTVLVERANRLKKSMLSGNSGGTPFDSLGGIK